MPNTSCWKSWLLLAITGPKILICHAAKQNWTGKLQSLRRNRWAAFQFHSVLWPSHPTLCLDPACKAISFARQFEAAGHRVPIPRKHNLRLPLDETGRSREEALQNCTSVTNESRVQIGPAFQPFSITYGSKLYLSSLDQLGKAGHLSAVSQFALYIDCPPSAFFGFGKEVNEVWLLGPSTSLRH